MGYAVKITGEVRINDFLASTHQCVLNGRDRMFGVPLRSIGVAVLMEIGLEDRLKDDDHGCLHYAVFDCRDAQGPQFPVSLWDVNPPHGAGLVGFALQLLLEFVAPA